MRAQVTVVVPNFNHASVIGVALGSILDQVSSKDEVIIIDDGSKDDSLDQITKILSNNTANARVIRHETNQGVIATLNEGLRLATKDYICFPGSDDIVLPTAFKQALELLAENPDAAFCSGRSDTIRMDGSGRKIFPTRNVLKVPGYLSPADVRHQLMQDDTWIIALTFYRTKCLREIGGFQEELGAFADGFASRLLALRYGCCFIPEALNLCRQDENSISALASTDTKRIEAIAETATRLMRGTYKNDFPRDYAKIWHRRWLFGARFRAMSARHRAYWNERFGLYSGRSIVTAAARGLVEGYLFLAGLVMFLRYRHGDSVAVIRRRLEI